MKSKIIILGTIGVLAVALLVFSALKSNNSEKASFEQPLVHQPIAEVCGKIRTVFLNSTNTSWNFFNCEVKSDQHIVVSVWSNDEPLPEGSSPRVFTSDAVPSAMRPVLCDIFFRSFEMVKQADFTITASDKKNPLMVFNLDRSICSIGKNSQLSQDLK